MSGAAVERKVAELRRVFDASFAEAPGGGEAEGDLVLAVRAGDGRFAVKVSELAGLHACGKIAALPGGPEGLLGIAGVRGRLVAVYDLAALLGRRARAHAGELRFLLLAGHVDPIALSVEALEGHARVAAIEPPRAAREDGPSAHVTRVFRHGDVTRELLSIPSLRAAIEDLAPGRRRTKRG